MTVLFPSDAPAVPLIIDGLELRGHAQPNFGPSCPAPYAAWSWTTTPR